jgi:hypothetical protein
MFMLSYSQRTPQVHGILSHLLKIASFYNVGGVRVASISHAGGSACDVVYVTDKPGKHSP